MLRFFLLTAVTAIWVLFSAKTAHATADLVLIQCDDEGLRAAINAIQAADGGSLTFQCPTEPATIVLTDGVLPVITTDTTIDGGGTITLSGGNASRILYVGATGTLRLRNLHLTRGLANGDGGALYSDGALHIENCTFSENQTTINFSGGAIVAYGPTTITGSTFTQNRAASGGAFYPRHGAVATISGSTFANNGVLPATANGWGGAILIWDGPEVDVSDTTFTGNTSLSGGAVYVTSNSHFTATGSTFALNQAETGGAIRLIAGGNVLLSDSLLEGNSADSGGALYLDPGAEVSVVDSTLQGNLVGVLGGAIFNRGVLAVRASLLTENQASSGGVLYNVGKASFTNSTLHLNSAGHGGAVANQGDAAANTTFINSTLSANRAETAGGAIFVPDGSAYLNNTIIVDSEPAGRANCEGGVGGPSVISQGFNLGDDGSCKLTQSTDLSSATSVLGPLGNFGGPTQSRLPLAGSPAIDAGSPVKGLTTDQRGVARSQGAAHDIGAVELRRFSLTVNKSGNGTVAAAAVGINCGNTCTGSAYEATTVTLTQTPSNRHKFVTWSGACSGSGACRVTLSGNRSVSATFAPNTALQMKHYLPAVRR